MTELLAQLFPGISTFFAMDATVAVARVVLILLGFILPTLASSGRWSP